MKQTRLLSPPSATGERDTGWPRTWAGHIPLAPPMAGAYCPWHIDAKLSPKAQRGLRAVQSGLIAAKECTEHRRVASAADVVNWILERVAETLPQSKPGE